MSLYFDGPLDEPTQDGPLIPSWDRDSLGRIWKRKMLQRASLWVPTPLDTPGPMWGTPAEPAGVLVEESDPSSALGEVVSWEQTFAEVPAPHRTAVGFTYTGPFAKTDGSNREASISTTATIVNDYFLTADPTEIPLVPKQTFANLTAILTYLGNVVDSSLIVAADSEVERYRGNIWRRKSPCVTKSVILPRLLEIWQA